MLARRYHPIPASQAVYERLHRRLHDIFGTKEHSPNLYDATEELLAVHDEVGAE